MDDHVRELLVTMDLTPTQISLNMWLYLIGVVLIFRAISDGNHDIMIEEFISLFQPKDGGGKAKGVLSCLSRLGARKIIQGLPNNI